MRTTAMALQLQSILAHVAEKLRSDILAWPRIQRLLKESTWVILGQLAAVAGAIFLVRAQTFYLNPTQLGELALTITLGTLLAQVTLFSVAPGILRYYAVAAESGMSRSYPTEVSRMVLLSSLVATGLLAIVLLVLYVVGRDEWILSTLIAGGLMIVSGIGTAWGGLLSAARARALAGLHAAGEPWLRVIAIAAVVAVSGPGVINVLVAYLLAVMVLAGSQYFFARRLLGQFKGAAEAGFRAPMWHYSRPFIAINLMIWAQASADRWALQTFATTRDVGLLSVLLQLGVTPISMAVGTMTVFITPILNNRMGDGSNQARLASGRQLALALLAVSMAITVAAVLVSTFGHQLIFAILVAPDYQEASYLLPWAAAAGGMIACTQVLYARIMSELRTDLLILPRLVTSIISVGLGALFAYFWGLDGIIAAMLVYTSAQLLWLIAILPRQPKLTATRQ